MGTVVLQWLPEELNLPEERQSPRGQLCYLSLHLGTCVCVWVAGSWRYYTEVIRGVNFPCYVDEEGHWEIDSD